MISTDAQTYIRYAPSWFYKAAAQAWIDYRFPRHLFLETTASCNLRCSYCPRERRGDHMAFDLFRQIVDEASQYGPRSFSLHLFGEPLLYPRAQEAVAYIRRANRRHVVLLTTNGTHLEKHLDWLVSLREGVHQIFWSWRKEATFSARTKERLRKWGRFRVRFIDEVTPKEAYEEWADWENVEGRSLHNYGGNISLPDSSTSPPQRWPCYHLWLAPAVAWNGQILICCADPHRKEPLGSYPQTTVTQAWQGKMLSAVRQSQKTGSFAGICKDCDVWKRYPNIWYKWQAKGT